MDFLDPQKQKAHRTRLLIGYVLIGLLVLLGTVILLYQAYGFGIDKSGQIIQNGLVFLSSEPGNADILVNGTKKAETNTRLNLPAGQYTVKLLRDGYRTWQRSIGVEGGSVERFVYPWLIPTKLQTSSIAHYAVRPTLVSESNDQRWLLTSDDATFGHFDVYDLAHPKNVVGSLTVPSNILTASAGAQSWQALAWASDNTHLLVKHGFTGADGQSASEYILLNRGDAAASVNLTKTFGANPTTLEFHGTAANQFYLYDQGTQTLSSASLNNPSPAVVLQHVLSFTTAGNDTLLYVDGAATTKQNGVTKVTVKLRQGSAIDTVGHVAVAPAYVLNAASYSGDWYIAFAASTDSKIDVYKNPADQLKNNDDGVLVPVAVLKVANPTSLTSSAASQFLLAEAGSNFAVFDAQTSKTYTYTLKLPMDTPQTSAVWVDDYHLAVTSAGTLHIFDFDSANQQTLVPADPNLLPAFDSKYQTLYTVAPQSAGGFALTSTSLLTIADQ